VRSWVRSDRPPSGRSRSPRRTQLGSVQRTAGRRGLRRHRAGAWDETRSSARSLEEFVGLLEADGRDVCLANARALPGLHAVRDIRAMRAVRHVSTAASVRASCAWTRAPSLGPVRDHVDVVMLSSSGSTSCGCAWNPASYPAL